MALQRITPGLTDNTLVTGRKIVYKDIDLTFSAKSGSLDSDGTFRGDLFKKTDTAAVIQSVGNVLLTNRLEKPFAPSFGGDLRAMLFDMVETYSESLIRGQIINALERDEPRVKVTDVQFFDGDRLVERGAARIFDRDSMRNTVAIKVFFQIDNAEGEFTAQVNMNRLR